MGQQWCTMGTGALATAVLGDSWVLQEVANSPTIESVDYRTGSPHAKQLTGREHSPTHQQMTGLKFYWAQPCPPEQDPVFPTASPSHQEARTIILQPPERKPQLTTKFCKSIILQLKNKLFKNRLYIPDKWDLYYRHSLDLYWNMNFSPIEEVTNRGIDSLLISVSTTIWTNCLVSPRGRIPSPQAKFMVVMVSRSFLWSRIGSFSSKATKNWVTRQWDGNSRNLNINISNKGYLSEDMIIRNKF